MKHLVTDTLVKHSTQGTAVKPLLTDTVKHLLTDKVKHLLTDAVNTVCTIRRVICADNTHWQLAPGSADEKDHTRNQWKTSSSWNE